jgi:membrane metallo-endopeptidase-like protein 1
MTASTVNAYYSPTHNQIVFPAGILQEPFFSVNYAQSVNYGGIGAIMGHELCHAFDDTGREHDKYGNLHQWWKNQTIDEFNKAAQCIVDQYSNYKTNGENINGKRTLGRFVAGNIFNLDSF